MRIRSFLMLMCIPAIIEAQVIDKLGIKAAFSRSMLAIEEFDDFSEWRTGFGAAVTLEKQNFHPFSISLQMEYTQKGYILEQVETDNKGNRIQDVRANTQFDCLSIPLLVRLTCSRRILSPFIAFGPRVDLVLGRHIGEFEFTEAAIEESYGGNIGSFAAGFSIAGGLLLPAGKGVDLTAEFRYNLDFTDALAELDLLHAKHISWNVWLGAMFQMDILKLSVRARVEPEDKPM